MSATAITKEIPTMPDPAPTPTDPNAPGPSTTEFQLTRLVVIIGAVIAGLAATLTQLHTVIPDAQWIATGLIILGAFASVLAVVSKYIGGRSDVKVSANQLAATTALLDAGVHPAQVELAKVQAASPPA